MNSAVCRSFVAAAVMLACTVPLRAQSQRDLPKEAEGDKLTRNVWLPWMEIAGFDLLVNRVNRRFSSTPEDYAVSLDSIRRNLHSSWGVDQDPFKVNQLGHPYQGAMYHGFARSAGFNYWESLGYTFAGSALWEIAGEQTPPSRNDQINSGIGGTFLGEALFRMSNLLLEKGGGMSPLWREAAATVIAPSAGFNRLVYGRRLDSIFASHDPAYYSRVQVGFMGTTKSQPGTSTVLKRNELQADFALDYGMPGKDGYHYERPFDYFAFNATSTTAGNFESVFTRGLLLGREYEAGKRYRGVWGLYGSYDYISPQTFRISSTSAALGTTGQWNASDAVSVQGTAMAGVGYAAVGTINGIAERDYHYGVTPQALVSMRMIFGDRSSLDFVGREYFVSRAAGMNRGGHDNIARADVSYTWRIRNEHAITIKYLWNRRDATYPDLGNRSQSRSTIGIFYTLLGQDHFGKVDWK
jgi:hypothetical protein